jgi:hypothetical protein
MGTKMAKTRVFEKQTAAVGATHAFVVGVGKYPTLPPEAGLRDLSTAAASAVAFCEWLTDEYDNPQAPLASVDLLLTPGSFKGRWCDGSIKVATLANVKAAFLEWAALAGSSPANVAIFYFAGHGVWYDKAHLLTEDFDPSNDLQPWAGSFSMEDTHNGMARCNAGYQLFFIEACQAIPGDLYDAPGIGSPGLLDRSVRPSAREAPIIYASKPHERAYGEPGEVANFTSALLEFLRGAGADQNNGIWEIATSDLVNVREIMQYRATMENGNDQEPHCELSGGRRLVSFNDPPRVQAHVTATPIDLIAQHELSAINVGDAFQKNFGPNPDMSPWRISLPKGLYQFKAGPVSSKPLLLPIWSPRPIVVLS